MSNWSIYGTGRLHIVDGVLSREDDERLSEELEALTMCIASGAARTFLNSTPRPDEPDAYCSASEWDGSGNPEGWELDVLIEDDKTKLVELVTQFVLLFEPYIIMLGHRVRYDIKWQGGAMLFEGGEYYEIGSKLAHELMRDGAGFVEFWRSSPGFAPGADMTDRMSEWVDQNGFWMEQPSIVVIDEREMVTLAG